MHREQDIIGWSKDRGIIDNGTSMSQSIKTLEEVTELLSACVACNRDEIKDAIGDIYVTIVNVAALSGLSMTECVDSAWEEIKDRKGYLNEIGIFIKES